MSALLEDTRLSREARIMGLHIANLGEGEHAISHRQFRILLGRSMHGGMPKDETIAQYVVELVSHGWIDRRPGGKGSPVYIFTPLSGGGIDLSPPLRGWETSDVSPPLRGGESYAPPSEGGREAFSPPLRGGQSVRSSSSRTSSSSGSSYARAREGGILEAEVEEEIHSPTWDGFRSSLEEYLADRVPLEGQKGYVMTLKTWLQGSPGGPRRLFTVPENDRPLLLASAFNELLQLNADEEAKSFRSARGRAGTTHVLRTKIEMLITRGSYGEERDSRSRSKSGIGRNQPAFPEDR